jgi:tRNA-specific 2-thiouridylase
MRVRAKIRYRQPEQPATVSPLEGDMFRVDFDSPQRAITKGQAVVLYDGELVIGGGTIV